MKIVLIIILAYFAVVIIVYYFMDGFYYSRTFAREQMYGQRHDNEFVYAGRDKVYKGIYVGETLLSGKAYYLLQFHDILIGANRYVNIYYPLDEEDDRPSVLESNEMLNGSPAFLILNPYGYYDDNNVSYDKIFKYDVLNNPVEFLDTISEDITKMDDSLFVTALTLMRHAMEVELMLWTKDSNSNYIPKKKQIDMFTGSEKEKCNINVVERIDPYKGLKKFGFAVADILTGSIQGAMILLYFAFVFITGGPAK